MSVIPVGYTEAVWQFTTPGDEGPSLCVTGHDTQGLGSLLAVLDAIEPAFSDDPSLLNNVSQDYTLAQVEVRWRQDAGDPVVGIRTINEVGRSANASVSPQVSYLLHKLSGRAGRKNRGRTYLPGVTQSVLDAAGFISGTALTNLAARGAAMLSQWAIAGAEMVILHTDPADSPTTVVSWEPASKVATQRRRLR